MNLLKLAEVAAELLIGLIKKEAKSSPPAPPPTAWRHVDSERAAQAGRCAGHETEPQCLPTLAEPLTGPGLLPTLAEATDAAVKKYGNVPLKLVGHDPKTGWIIVPKHPDEP